MTTKTIIYLVGGAVRDQLLQKPVRERDWVVIGATPEQMIKQGYKPVGKDFPVFLHPDTHEEYALGRSERKIAPGYQGFTFHTSPDITLEEDLIRRDLTINAIAQDELHNLIDPYGGQKDLEQKILRHVSSAFAEDPVRLLRLARFSTYLPDFTIHSETLSLLKKMVEDGEVDALVPERVFQELRKSLTYNDIQPFFETLNLCGALPIIFPNINIDALDFTSYKKISDAYRDEVLKFACLWKNVDSNILKKLFQKLRVPKDWQKLTSLYRTSVTALNNWQQMSDQSILQWFQSLQAFRNANTFTMIKKLMQQLQTTLWSTRKIDLLYEALSNVKAKDIIAAGFSNADIGREAERQRLEIIKTLRH